MPGENEGNPKHTQIALYTAPENPESAPSETVSGGTLDHTVAETRGTVLQILAPGEVPPDALESTIPAKAPADTHTVIAPRQPEVSAAPVGNPTVHRAVPQEEIQPVESDAAPSGTIVRKPGSIAKSSDVMLTVDAKMPHELKSAIVGAHAAFLEWREEMFGKNNVNREKTKDRFSASVKKIEDWLEIFSLQDIPLEPEERLQIVSRILFGKPPKELAGQDAIVLQLFREALPKNGVVDETEDHLTALLGKFEKLDFCFANHHSDAILLQLLEIERWGARNARRLMKDLALESGYSTSSTAILGEGAMGRVIHLLKEGKIGEDEELVLKYSTIGMDMTHEVNISAKASAAGAGPRTIESTRPNRALFMVYQKNAAPLESVMKRTPFNPALMAHIASQVHTLHAAGIVHRDLKSGNVLVLENKTDAKIIDYGLAMEVGKNDPYEGSLLGTPDHMAPEAANGTYNAKTDVYALGCIAFEWSVGESWSHWVAKIKGDSINNETTWDVLRRTHELSQNNALFEQALNHPKLQDKPKLREALEKTLNPVASKRIRSAEAAAALFAEAEA